VATDADDKLTGASCYSRWFAEDAGSIWSTK
jgi:hypothetical protein